jgi:D-alanyl-D-alanine dipeptidase
VSNASGETEELDVPLIRELQKLSDENDDAGYLAALNKSLAKVRTEENGEPLLRLSREKLQPRIFLWLVNLDIPADDKHRLQLRESVVDRLTKAAHSLPSGYSLLIRDAFRTEKMVWELYRMYMLRLKQREPLLNEKERDLRIRNLLAMPDDPVPPGHMTGGAVDINLGDANGRRVDLEVGEDLIPRRLQALIDCVGLPQEITERRRMLLEVLTNQGFHNYSREYWHYSFGDAYWAVRRRDKVAIYGIPASEQFR